ncbi:MAG: M28 family peptidase, partial [Gaiellaceae bacterium]
MRRLLFGVMVTAVLASLAGSPTATAGLGSRAKAWAGEIAALGQRPAGGRHERQAGGIVRRRLLALGYDVETQRFPLPGDGRSLNVVGRTPGPIRAIVVAHMDGVPGTNAANDNGSGVGLMLALAESFRDDRGVLVAALGAEERRETGAGYHLGSRRLTRSLTANQKEGVRFAVSV